MRTTFIYVKRITVKQCQETMSNVLLNVTYTKISTENQINEHVMSYKIL